MIRELKHQIKIQYLVLLILMFIALIFFIRSGFVVSEADIDKDYNFIVIIDKYDSIEELQKLYNNNKMLLEDATNNIPGMSVGGDIGLLEKKDVLYRYLLKNQLPYDSCVLMTRGNNLNTQFSFLGFVNDPYCVFIYVICMLVGSFAFAKDFNLGTAKLVYTIGQSRTKIVLKKYLVGLIIVTAIASIGFSIFSIIGSYLSKNGVQYALAIVDGQAYGFNYFQCYLLYLSNILIFTVMTYSVIYFISVLICNTNGSLVCAILIFIVFNFVFLRLFSKDALGWSNGMLNMLIYGPISWLTDTTFYGEITVKCWQYIFYPIIVVAFSIASIRIFIKREIKK